MKADPHHPDMPNVHLAIHDEFEARYWARTLGMSKKQVRELFGTGQVPAGSRDEAAVPCSIAPLLRHLAPSTE